MGKTLSNSVEGFDEGSQWHYEMYEVCLVNHSQFDKLFSPQNFTAIHCTKTYKLLVTVFRQYASNK